MVVWVEQITLNKLKGSALVVALQYFAAAIGAFFCLVCRKAKHIWLDRYCTQTSLCHTSEFQSLLMS